MSSEHWTELETSTHQDHVINHVIGASVLGWMIARDAAHLLLYIGFLWTVYIDGEMNLLPQGVAIAELDADEITAADRTELAFDVQLLLAEGREATGLKRFTPAPVECLIVAVDFLGVDSRRRIAVRGEIDDINIDDQSETGEIYVSAAGRAG